MSRHNIHARLARLERDAAHLPSAPGGPWQAILRRLSDDQLDALEAAIVAGDEAGARVILASGEAE